MSPPAETNSAYLGCNIAETGGAKASTILGWRTEYMGLHAAGVRIFMGPILDRFGTQIAYNASNLV